MGTSLTGTKPKDTYDSLIKVGDNGPLSGTAKYLSDGLGNDSVLALSTSRVLVNHTNTPKGDLDIASSANAVPFVIRGRSSDNQGQTEFWSYDGATRYGVLGSTPNASYFGSIAATYLYFLTNATEQMRITSAGVVELAQGQIKFPATQVASADPNTLDDYEEGTWTMGISFGNASVGVTYAFNTGRYTKIGRQVTAVGFLGLSSKGTSTGSATITGLPFTIAAGTSNYSASTFAQMALITYTGQMSGYGTVGNTTILLQTTNAGSLTSLTDSNFANNSEIMVTFTYFV